LDWILIGIVSISVIAAAMRGFVYEIWMMLAALAAIVLAAWEYGAVGAHLSWISSDPARSVAAFAVIVIAVLFVAAVVGRLVRGLLHTAGLGPMDRVLGAGLGFARGVALAAALVLVLTAYPVEAHWVRRSTLAPDLLWGSRALVTVMPPGMVTRFESGVRAQWRHIAQP
jgi:membrane protein required for colicin V production